MDGWLLAGFTDEGYTDGWTERQPSGGVRSRSVESQTCDGRGVNDGWMGGWMDYVQMERWIER